MKLETKHLAPYLPYNLMCEVLNSGQEKEIGEMIAVYNDGSACFGNIVESDKGFEYIKPILFPLTELEYYTNGLKHLRYRTDKDAVSDIISDIENGVAEFKIMSMCFQEHIDVFGLIKNGLAIDVNTLDVQNDG